MPKPVLTPAAWAAFDATVFDGSVASASKTQAQARRVFYGGAQAILDILMAARKPSRAILTAWRL